MRVLVVDDDEAGRYLVSTILKHSGHEVVEAADGSEALEKARQQPVDIVVSDILMPNMDGYALCRAWKADPELSKAPLVFYTATYTEPADERFAQGLGADGFFTKPQEPEILLHLLADVVHDHAERGLAPRAAEGRPETEVLREYNERLVSKLEHKLVELNEANAGLRQAIELLTDETEVKKRLIEKLTVDGAEREQQHRELLEASDTLSAVVSASPLAIVTLDTGFTVTSWNAAAERVLGWTAAEAVGSIYPAVAESEIGAFADGYGPLLRGEVAGMEREIVRHRKDGSEVVLWSRVAPLHDADGTVMGLLALIQDVTESHRIEMVKAGFLSMISHELRTPLTAIVGYSDLLDRADPRTKPDLFVRSMAKIRERADYMRRLVDNLLTLSQIQSGPLALAPARVDVASFLRAEVARAAITDPHELTLDVAEDLPAVFIDAQRMGSAVQHLTANAVKYSPDGGEITVSASAEDDFVRISIADHGIGIAKGDLSHVFDRFTQADMSDSRSFGGIGVGLFLARQIVEAHRGRMEAESTLGEGSVFTIVLPVIG